MYRLLAGLAVVVLVLPFPATAQRPSQPAGPAAQYQAITREFNSEGYALRQAATDEEREQIVLRVEKLTQRLMEIADKYPRTPIAMEALVQAVNHELWMENNTSHQGRGQDSPEVRAIAILMRDHARSDKAADACRRLSYGFRKECDPFIRKVLEVNPHRNVRGLACLYLAQFLNSRQQRLELLRERPEMAGRYADLFGKDYLRSIRRRARANALHEVGTVFERAAREYPDVQLPFGGTVGEKANSELYELRHLVVGRAAPEIEGDDQEGVHFKLADYRGKVILLYFWSEY